MEKLPKYFPGLHALRFFAAAMVIFHHIEQYKSWAGHDNLWGNEFIGALGHEPVAFFFVLSGFLITFFLLKEHQKTRRIDLRLFYWKRIIRIWPLYFIIVAIALFIVPMLARGVFNDEHFAFGTPSVVALLFFLPNLLRLTHPIMAGGNQLWSVGVEEQFYIFWPLLVGLFAKRIFSFLLGFIFIKLSLQALLEISGHTIHWLDQLHFLAQIFPVEQMAIGGLGAALVFHQKTQWLAVLQSRWTVIAACITAPLLFLLDLSPEIKSVGEATLFLIIILQVIYQPRLHRPLEKKWLKTLGDASYGIYMYHTICIVLVMVVFEYFQITGALYHIGLYIVAFTLTIIMACYSYKHLEQPILKFKNNMPSLLSINLLKRYSRRSL